MLPAAALWQLNLQIAWGIWKSINGFVTPQKRYSIDWSSQCKMSVAMHSLREDGTWNQCNEIKRMFQS